MADHSNPYAQRDNKPIQLSSAVAFIDILGYKDRVEEAEKVGKGQYLLENLHEALSRSSGFIKPGFILDDHAIRAFTDNIVLGYPIRKDGEIELTMFSIYLSSFQLSMILSGFFIRGGIAIGNLYMDDTVVYGNGLIEAYKAESYLARDPRIVLSVSAKEAVNKHLGYYGGHDYAPQVDQYSKDSDGQYFLNYLRAVFHEDSGDLREDILFKHKEITESMLTKWKESPIIWAKYAWVANYHNYFCSQHDQIEDSFKINMADFNLLPTRINK
ncbi:MAG: hypothetical protein ABSE05_16620 [Syntrophales bacterium]|jgi:hypothetical protein